VHDDTGMKDDSHMLTELSNQLADAVSAAAPSVVQVAGRRQPVSGIVHAPGIVVTTIGAIGGENGIQVRRHDGRAADAELAGWDDASGLAVLRAAGIDAPPLALSNAEVRVGSLALAVGRSWSNAVTASAGIVAVIGGPLRTGRRRSVEQVIRTTAPMHDGFAGGAFLDTTGRLAGIITRASIRGMRVILPAAFAWQTVSAVLERGRIRRGYLGITGQPVSLPEGQRPGGRERGVLVVGVTHEGPAAGAGVLVGDVLVAVNGTTLESPEDLLDALRDTGAGNEVTLALVRGAAPHEVRVTAAERPRR
jgi:S1-C subfamily serine protease